jgi:hypothetical protein
MYSVKAREASDRSTARFGAKASQVTAQDVAELRKQTSR